VRPSTPEEHRRTAQEFEAAYAEEPDEVLHLFEAANQWQLAGNLDAALAVLDRIRGVAVDDEDLVGAEVETVMVLKALGRGAEAAERLDRFRRARPEPEHCGRVAEALEDVGELAAARRWFDQGVAALHEHELDDHRAGDGSWEVASLLRGRRRVRHALGLPPDLLDLTVALPPGEVSGATV
jgi:tetratricopeptide (TPR) repeat protein